MRFMRIVSRGLAQVGPCRLMARLSVILAPVLVLVACGPGAEPTPTPLPPTPTPPPKAVGEIVADAADAMTQVTSFRFALVNEGGETPIAPGMGLKRAAGVTVKPDQLKAEVNAVVSGLAVRIDVIGLSDKTYLTNPFDGTWSVSDSALSPLQFFDIDVGVPMILRSLLDPSKGPDGFSEGRPFHTVTARIPAEAVQFIAGSFVAGSILDIELLIGQENSYLLEATLKGRITEDEPEGIVRTLSFSGFGEAFEIDPPI